MHLLQLIIGIEGIEKEKVMLRTSPCNCTPTIDLNYKLTCKFNYDCPRFLNRTLSLEHYWHEKELVRLYSFIYKYLIFRIVCV